MNVTIEYVAIASTFINYETGFFHWLLTHSLAKVIAFLQKLSPGRPWGNIPNVLYL